MENKIYIDGKEYNLKNFEPKPSLQDIVIVTIANEQDEAECEADYGYHYSIIYKNDKINVEFVQINESIESILGNTDDTEKTKYSQNIAEIDDASIVDYINLIVDYILYKKEYIFTFGNQRMHKIHFTLTQENEEEIMNQNEELGRVIIRLLNKYRR